MSGQWGPRQWSRALGIILAVVMVVAAAGRRAAKQGVGTDFHVFWQAGYNFAHGLPLYQPLPGVWVSSSSPSGSHVISCSGWNRRDDQDHFHWF